MLIELVTGEGSLVGKFSLPEGPTPLMVAWGHKLFALSKKSLEPGSTTGPRYVQVEVRRLSNRDLVGPAAPEAAQDDALSELPDPMEWP